MVVGVLAAMVAVFKGEVVMFDTDSGTGGEDERRQHPAEDPSHHAVRDRHAVRFSRRHRRQHSRWPLYAAGAVFALLLLLWWLAGR